MAQYLDPKADLTFKKVFGEHKDLVISFLNALLPLGDEQSIKEIEYLTPEMVPENPLRKFSIVDVRCQDAQGRQFIVEMQMLWSSEFKSRVMFNAAKAYVRQLGKGVDYQLLHPVYSLNLVNEIFETDLETCYHYYSMVHHEHSDKVIEGLHLVFIELPKFKPQSYSDKKMMSLWLRFLTEINEKTTEVPSELLEEPKVKKALDIVRESAFTKQELEGYDMFWDRVSTEKTLFNAAERKGMEAGMAKGMEAGMAKGMEAGMAKGRAEEKAQMAIKMIGLGINKTIVAKVTGLDLNQIEDLG